MDKNACLKRLLRVLLPMVLLFVIIMASTRVEKQALGPDTSAVYVRATVTQILADQSGGQPFTGNQKVQATVTSGTYKGRSCQLQNSNSYHTGAFCEEGTRVIALVSEKENGELGGTVYNYDRTGMVYLLIGMFALTLICVGGKKGAAALYALVSTFVCVLCMYVPLLYIGTNGILAGVLTAVTILAVSIYILNGWSVKTLCAMIGTTIGVGLSGVLAMAIGGGSQLSGYNSADVEALVYLGSKTGLDIANVLYAGVLISSLGAVMDVSVSIVAAMAEIREKAPRLKAAELFASGMRVGHDMMGTMSNTLILAYAGSATSVLLYTYGMPYLKIMGNNDIVTEILCGLCGTIGVIATVPIQAAITAMILRPKDGKKR